MTAWWRNDNRYAPANNWRKPPRHPTPSETFQRAEYEAVMGRAAPDLWDEQFDYTPRSKYGRELLQSMVA